MRLINGKEISEIIVNELRNDVDNFKNQQITPTINIFQIGDVAASSIYVRNKKRLCDKIGVNCNIIKLEEQVGENELIKLINDSNNDKNINGILVQLPLPSHINENKIIESISPIKDVDCFNELNVGKL
jgi:methylenetetrahydrofolate dehydrogenase (NADP+)/methenyltetrahydrofolate cyclohydrolase